MIELELGPFVSFFDRFEIAIFGVKQAQKLCKMGCLLAKWICTMVVYVNGMDLAISSLFLDFLTASKLLFLAYFGSYFRSIPPTGYIGVPLGYP